MTDMKNLHASATEEIEETLRRLANMAALLAIHPPRQPQATHRAPRADGHSHVLQSSVVRRAAVQQSKDLFFDAQGLYDYVRLPPRASNVRREHNHALGTSIQQAVKAQGRPEYRAFIGQMLHAESIRVVAHAVTDDDLVTGQRLRRASERAATAKPTVRLYRVRPQSAY